MTTIIIVYKTKINNNKKVHTVVVLNLKILKKKKIVNKLIIKPNNNKKIQIKIIKITNLDAFHAQKNKINLKKKKINKKLKIKKINLNKTKSQIEKRNYKVKFLENNTQNVLNLQENMDFYTQNIKIMLIGGNLLKYIKGY